MKKCGKCKDQKHRSEFYSNKRNRDGLSTWCADCTRVYDQEYREKNREQINKLSNTYYHDNHDKFIEYSNSPLRKKKRKAYNQLPTTLERNNNRLKSKRQSDPMFKLSSNLRVTTKNAFKAKKWRKNGSTMVLLGVDCETAKKHIERQFKKGMTWDNYGKFGWHIDHIIPLASAKTEEELILLCHYTNLQPLWATENHKKYNKIPQVQTQLRL